MYLCRYVHSYVCASIRFGCFYWFFFQSINSTVHRFEVRRGQGLCITATPIGHPDGKIALNDHSTLRVVKKLYVQSTTITHHNTTITFSSIKKWKLHQVSSLSTSSTTALFFAFRTLSASLLFHSPLYSSIFFSFSLFSLSSWSALWRHSSFILYDAFAHRRK